MELCIEIAGDRVRCKQDGKEVLAVALADFLAIVAQHSEVLALPDVIPEGVRFLHRRGEAVVLVIEEKPQPRTVRWLADESPEHGNFSPESLGGGTVRMILTVPDPDATFAQSVAAGAREVVAVAEAYGWRLGRVVDPFGHHWEIGRPLAS